MTDPTALAKRFREAAGLANPFEADPIVGPFWFDKSEALTIAEALERQNSVKQEDTPLIVGFTTLSELDDASRCGWIAVAVDAGCASLYLSDDFDGDEIVPCVVRRAKSTPTHQTPNE